MTDHLDICARLACPDCGAAGTGFWRRDALRGQGRELLGLTRGFTRRPGDRRADPCILCVACRAPARELPFRCVSPEAEVAGIET
ncbi:hypothetical protein [Paracraurococcus ruber]|uniref:Uncharacterized protein n=1 Tax=Paracraurococcus ruber TaxID=77675 RepID=A0ABS1D1F7_9PROT|nr:hypothetical protein [Paracraurococcus ruber]MBK1660336.1 hypothetical protein [Paracraurococcus ruber]TDG31355.1 hypothetical protein E2C05_11345 [Paracraurococcus ruber]